MQLLKQGAAHRATLANKSAIEISRSGSIQLTNHIEGIERLRATSQSHTIKPKVPVVPKGFLLRDEAVIAQIPDFGAGPPPSVDEVKRQEAVRRKVLLSHRAWRLKQEPHQPVLQSDLREQFHTLSQYDKQQVIKYQFTRASGQPPFQYVDPCELHPNGIPPPGYRTFDAFWETSGLQPGQPGFGYKPEGTPLGSVYIEYMRGRKASTTTSRDQALVSKKDEEDLIFEELEQAGWDEPLARASAQNQHSKKRKRKQRFDMRDVKRQVRRHEEEALTSVLRFNSENHIE